MKKRNPRGSGRKRNPAAMAHTGRKLNMWMPRELMDRLTSVAQQRDIPLAVHVREVLEADAARRW